jgi:hypothetical protein
MATTATIPQFQRFVWESLPIRKQAIDREFIDDIVLVAIQQWPNDELSQAAPGSPEEAEAIRRVQWDIRRILEFTYGHDRFAGYWLLGARIVIPQVAVVILKWWRRRKDNRARIGIWRRRWVA